MRYYAIGDIHGRFDLVEKARESIKLHGANSEYKVIFLGDYIDRGPESKQVIEHLIEAQKVDPDVICLQGNHEAMVVETVLRSLKPDWWLGNGGNTTLLSYGHPFDFGKSTMLSFIPQEHIKWMASLPKFYEAEKQVFVHAGIPQWGMNLPPKSKHANKMIDAEEQMQWMLYHPTDSGGWKGKHVVHGHHQHRDGPHTWKDAKKGGRTNLDTFAWKTGRLVVGVFDDSQLDPIDFIEVKDENVSGSD